MESARFFEPPHEHFFRPLNGRYREAAVNCIRALYLRVNGPDADYDYHLTRRDVDDIFAEALRRSPVLDGDGEEERLDALSIQDRAAAMRRRLEGCGWIERYSDPGSMRVAYRFTPRGRQFAAPFAQQVMDEVTLTQNTRSTLAHLNAFYSKAQSGEVSIVDLMIAHNFSRDIVNDFNQIIEELIERKRRFAESATRQLEHARAIGESFFDYMDSRFVPDMTLRFNEDSVERFRHQIIEALDRIEALPDTIKAAIEKRLREYYPALRKDRESILYWVLERIRNHIQRACEAKLPELRRETRNFVRRADALLRHLAEATYQGREEGIAAQIARLNTLSKADIDRVLEDPRCGIPRIELALLNPERVRLKKRKAPRPVDSALDEPPPLSREEKIRKKIRDLLEEAFRADFEVVSEYVIEKLADGHRIRVSELPVSDARSLLSALHALELGSSSRQGSGFSVHPLAERFDNGFFEGQDFVIEYHPEASGP